MRRWRAAGDGHRSAWCFGARSEPGGVHGLYRAGTLSPLKLEPCLGIGLPTPTEHHEPFRYRTSRTKTGKGRGVPSATYTQPQRVPTLLVSGTRLTPYGVPPYPVSSHNYDRLEPGMVFVLHAQWLDPMKAGCNTGNTMLVTRDGAENLNCHTPLEPFRVTA